MDLKGWSLVIGFVGMPAGGLAGDIIQVPGDQPTIQAGIDAARNGDTVLVADGTYVGPGNTDLSFGGRLITLRSSGGDPTRCVIDCQNVIPSRGFTFQSGETAAALVAGITIRNANAATGGGAIRIEGSSPTVENCVLEGNRASGFVGGAGGGMWIQSGSPTVTHCIFMNNSVGNPKVGLFGRGGGLYIGAADPTVINCVFVGNSAVAAPSQMAAGGGLYTAEGGAPIVVNCTFVSNTVDDAGGAVFSDSAGLTMISCIIWNNSPDELSLSGGSITYCDVLGGWPGRGNIDADPRFADPDDADFRLLSGSPCIDAGDSTAVPMKVTTDLEGNSRFVDDPDTPDTGNGMPPIVDMGAYEFQVAVACPADVTGDGVVDVQDLTEVILNWGGSGVADINGDGTVDVQDLAAVVLAWGPCG